MSNDDLEQWAARVAPTLDADSWAALRCFEQEVPPSGGCPPQLRSERFHPQGCAALLAYRDSVVAKVSMQGDLANARLARVVRGEGPSMPASSWLVLRRLGLVSDDAEATDFGREVARVLGGAK